MRFSGDFVALLREAGIAAELLASGVTALGRASSSQHGYYNLAFFNLSTGFERAAKLAIVIDHCIDHSGGWPSDAQLRDYGHDVQSLLNQVGMISQKRRQGQPYSELPRTEIHQGVLSTLSEFAKATRYYNLDYLSGGRSADLPDPLASWFGRVGAPILERHRSARMRRRDEVIAAALEITIGDIFLLRSQTEAGDPIEGIKSAALHSALTRIIQRYGRLYVLQLARFLAFTLSDLQHAAHAAGYDNVPFISEFFALFMNEDSYLKKRATWSIYGL